MFVVDRICLQCWQKKSEHLARCKHKFRHINPVLISQLLQCKGRKLFSPSSSRLQFNTKSNVRWQTWLQYPYFQHCPDIWPNMTVGPSRTADCQPLAWVSVLCVSCVICWLIQNRSTCHCSVANLTSPQIVDTAVWFNRHSNKLISFIMTRHSTIN
jgi:hypothetical protein